MVAEQFPLFKLATLLARQMSSPIASRIKRYAVSHPRFGVQVCRRVAQLYQRGEWGVRALVLRLGGVRLPLAARPPQLTPRAAQDLGGDLLGEMILFTLGSLIIIFEVNRQADKVEAKALEERSRWLAASLALEELQRELLLQQQEMNRLHAVLRSLLEPPAPPAAPPTAPLAAPPVASPVAPPAAPPAEPPAAPSAAPPPQQSAPPLSSPARRNDTEPRETLPTPVTLADGE